jgi:hypothetical protein
MNSQLACLSSLYILLLSLSSHICVVGLYGAFWESLVLTRFYKWDVVKTRQASHGLTETRQKGHWKIMSYQGGEREKYTHFRWVDMCKWQRVIPRHKGSPRYRIAHGWKMRMDLLNLKPLNFLMHFREPGSSFHAYSYFFFFLIFLILFFLSFFHSFFSCHSFSHETFTLEFWFFYFAPLLNPLFLITPLWTLKIASYLPPPPCLDVARPRAKRR